MSHLPQKSEARDHEFGEVRRVERAPTQHLNVDDLKDVRLPLTVDLGICSMLVREVIELKRGSVIRLNKTAGDATDVYVGEQPVAKGEVVVIGDSLHVRIGDIIGAEERSEDDGFSK